MLHRRKAAYRPLIAALCIVALAIPGCGRRAPDSSSVDGSFPAVNHTDGLPAIVLVDQNGNRVALDSLRGTPVLIDFVYSNCTSSCPMLTEKMLSVAKLLGDKLGRTARIVSVTLDPDRDTPAQLLKYADQMQANRAGWLFLTGSPEQIDRVLAVYGLKRDLAPDGSIMHMNAAFLLGRDGMQVRQYNAIDVSAATVVRDIDRAAGQS